MSEIHPGLEGKSISAYCIVIRNTFRRDFVPCQWDLVPQTDVRQQHRLGRIVVVGKHARPSKERKSQNQAIGVKRCGWISLARCLRRVYAALKFRNVERVWDGLTQLTFQGTTKVFPNWIADIAIAGYAVPTSFLIAVMGFTAGHTDFRVWINSEASKGRTEMSHMSQRDFCSLRSCTLSEPRDMV